VKDAQSHAEEDKQRQEEIEARNRLDSLVYATEKTIRDNREKLSEPDVKPVEEALGAARKALEDGGNAKLEAAAQDLTKASHRLAEVLYQQAAASGAAADAAPAGEPKKGDGDVIDAEVVDDSKK
jgi:molecular chaperone DnaK